MAFLKDLVLKVQSMNSSRDLLLHIYALTATIG